MLMHVQPAAAVPQCTQAQARAESCSMRAPCDRVGVNDARLRLDAAPLKTEPERVGAQARHQLHILGIPARQATAAALLMWAALQLLMRAGACWGRASVRMLATAHAAATLTCSRSLPIA